MIQCFQAAASSLDWRKLVDVGAVDTLRAPTPLEETKDYMIGICYIQRICSMLPTRVGALGTSTGLVTCRGWRHMRCDRMMDYYVQYIWMIIRSSHLIYVQLLQVISPDSSKSCVRSYLAVDTTLPIRT
jgi:hypothetical protein